MMAKVAKFTSISLSLCYVKPMSASVGEICRTTLAMFTSIGVVVAVFELKSFNVNDLGRYFSFVK